jgi:outer membrane protein assembly factor BamA
MFDSQLPVMGWRLSQKVNSEPPSHLREGELFNVERIRSGIDNLTKLYSSEGYIDFTVSPQLESAEKLRRISLLMSLDEQNGRWTLFILVQATR